MKIKHAVDPLPNMPVRWLKTYRRLSSKTETVWADAKHSAPKGAV